MVSDVVIGAIVSGVSLVVGYVAAFFREVLVAGKHAQRDREARLDARTAQRDDRQRAYLTELQEHLAAFGRAMASLHHVYIMASRTAGHWTLTKDREASDADMAARTRIAALRPRLLDDEARTVILDAISIPRELILPASAEEAQAAMNALMERLDAAHERIGLLLRDLEPTDP